jgi:hypothetical protein
MKNKRLNKLLGTVGMIGLLSSNVGQSAYAFPLNLFSEQKEKDTILIDAKMESPVYGILELKIKKPKNQKINISNMSCKINLKTNSESYWTTEDIINVTQRYVKTDFKLKSNGSGAVLHIPCGSEIEIKETDENFFIKIDTNLKPIYKNNTSENQKETKSKNKNLVSPKIKPVARPDNPLENLIKKSEQDSEQIIKENNQSETPNEENNSINKTIKTELVTSENNNRNTEINIPTDYDLQTPKIRKEIQKEEVILPKEIMIDDFSGDFLETRQSLTRDLSNTDSFIKLAEFFFQNGLYKESESILNDIESETLPEDQMLYLKALSEINNILYNTEPELSNEVINNKTYKDWSHYNLWTGLLLSKNKSHDEAANYLEGTDKIIENYPKIIQKEIIPNLIESAIESGEWNEARDLSLVYEDLVSDNDTVFNYLLGRAALKNDKITEAFDSFAKSSLGDDIFAQKSKLNIVDIGLSTKTMPLADAKVFLDDIIINWGGGEIEFEALKRLISIHEEEEDNISALLSIGDTIRRFPKSSEEMDYEEKAINLIETVYDMGINGEVSLDEFFENHKLLKQSFGFFNEFHQFTEKYADKLLENGATLAAANEYISLKDQIEVLPENKQVDGHLFKIEELKLKAAESHIQGLRTNKADRLLDSFNSENAPELKSKYNLLKAQIQNNIGNKKEVVELLQNNEDFESLKLSADTHFLNENWEKSYNKYNKIKDLHPNKFNQVIAIKSMIAAHKNDDSTSVYDIVSFKPELLDSEEWRIISEGLGNLNQSIESLNKNFTKERVNSFEETENTLNDALSQDGLQN